MKTLFVKIKQLVLEGYTVNIGPVLTHIQIDLHIDWKGQRYAISQWLPLSDHFYEDKIVDLLNWMESEIKKTLK